MGHFSLDADLDFARPGVVALFNDLQPIVLKSGRQCRSTIEVQGDSSFGLREQIAADTGDKSRDIHRAAGAMCQAQRLVSAIAFQRVVIEVMRSRRATGPPARR